MAKLMVLLLVFALAAAACGDSDADEAVTQPTSVPVAEVSPEEPEAPAPTEAEVVESTPPPTPTPMPIAAIVPVAKRLPADPDAPAAAWVAGVNAAGWDFHRQLEGNAVSSPISIGTAFSLARAGASPDTGVVLDEIFGFPAEDPDGAANAVDLAVSAASAEPTTLEIANRLFPDDDFSPLPAFLDTAATQYGATIQPIDTADAEAAAGVVNGWVSETTRGLIPTIVTPRVVRDQELVLVNTVYLEADWAVPFLAEFTTDDEFTLDDGSTVTTAFMGDRIPVERRFVRLDDLGADAVELPYVGDELAMWLIVPRNDDGLESLEASIDAGTITGLGAVAIEGMVELTMPKWEQELPPTDLFAWLCPQGFCPGAAFDDIAPGIFTTGALHGAKVIVDEEGTEAAAATAMAFESSGPPPADLTVVADHPFLWTIVHEPTGTILFVGRLVDPTS